MFGMNRLSGFGFLVHASLILVAECQTDNNPAICQSEKSLGHCDSGSTVAWNQANCAKSCSAEIAAAAAASSAGDAVLAALPKAKAASKSGDKKLLCSDPSLSGLKDGFKPEEILEIMELINKMRCVVGAPDLKWDKDLACGAQKSEDTNGYMVHTPGLPTLPGRGTGLTGENIQGLMDPAVGSIPAKDSIPLAVYNWFLEYTNQCKDSFWMTCPGTGHYSGIAYRSITSLGCGITRAVGKNGQIRCQFHVGEDNSAAGSMTKMIFMPGQFKTQAPYFKGTEAEFNNPKCHFPLADLKKWAKSGFIYGFSPKAEFKGIGLDLETEIVAGDQRFSVMGVAALAVAGVAFAAIGVVVRRRTTGSAPQNSDEELLESSPE